MLSKISVIKNSTVPMEDLSSLLEEVHLHGPDSSDILETISLYKEFHPREFLIYEDKFISALGLFYKNPDPENLYSLLLSTIGNRHVEEFGRQLTPVQASVRRAVDSNQFVSISAPTSAGKSYSIRDFIAEQSGDAVIIVPSRALIAEYISSIKRRFHGSKDVYVSAYGDDVFKIRNLRHIFVLTPERARELFASTVKLNIKVFFFDEAQTSEEKERGVVFDLLVRRIRKIFPSAKLIFAHPFVENPEAQLRKHGINEDLCYARSYTYGTVGKISIFQHENGKDFYFTPFLNKGHHIKNCEKFEGSFEDFAFNGINSVLIYVSKASIYNGEFLIPFQSHIDNLTKVTDSRALEIVANVERLLGADQNEHRSSLVALLRKGVVIHHGSVPLEVRFLVEDFIRGKFARLCFATSTLAQGVNMPFDVVWLHNMRMNGEGTSDRSLSFKNLIGRAGRLSEECVFDYGYVFTKNPLLYSSRVNDIYTLSEISVIDSDLLNVSEETRELVQSVKDDLFDDEFNLPLSRVERFKQLEIMVSCETILDLIYSKSSIRESVSGAENLDVRIKIKECFRTIFVASIGRELFDGEGAVFDTAIRIFLLAIGGRTFREISGIRFSDISKRDKGRTGVAAFSQQAAKIPDSSLQRPYPLFSEVLASEVSYDAVVFDTYDYMDQVISFSLSDVFSAAFKIYGDERNDGRYQKILELLRFGTNDVTHMLLMRYGFSPEVVSEIIPLIKSINENEIIFNSNINSASMHIRDMIDWYLPE